MEIFLLSPSKKPYKVDMFQREFLNSLLIYQTAHDKNIVYFTRFANTLDTDLI